MACLLTSGRSLGCKSKVGGLKAIYFADYGTLGAATIVEGEITVLDDVSAEWFKFDIKGASNLETSITSSRENGTTFYTQNLNITLPVLDKKTQEEIKILAVSRPHIAVEDYNGNFFLIGLDNGAELTGGTIVSGAAMGDLSGFTLVFEGQEKAPAYFVLSTVITAKVSPAKIDPTA
tara:strand:- start:74 stop:604 length:531 start_codon:yes stop_codon:yes gene_type:complete